MIRIVLNWIEFIKAFFLFQRTQDISNNDLKQRDVPPAVPSRPEHTKSRVCITLFTSSEIFIFKWGQPLKERKNLLRGKNPNWIKVNAFINLLKIFDGAYVTTCSEVHPNMTLALLSLPRLLIPVNIRAHRRNSSAIYEGTQDLFQPTK